MSKTIIFDMDGTIADLYGVESWEEKIRAEKIDPYLEAKPLYDMETLGIIVDILRDFGYHVIIVSWGTKDDRESTPAYNREIRKAKLQWLEHYGFPYDEIHVVKYGTPKQKYCKGEVSILVDDNDNVLNEFMKKPRGRRVIDAKQNIIKELIKLLAE